MLDGSVLVDAYDQARDRVLAHYRVERRYGGNPWDAMLRVRRAWAMVVIDYGMEGQPVPPAATLALNYADACLRSIPERGAYWQPAQP